MQQNKWPVSIMLETRIDDGEDQEVIKVEASGDWIASSERTVLFFNEESDDGVVKTMITVKDDQVTIKRSGSVKMTQHFDMKKNTENVYRHAYGTMHVETKTDKIHFEPLDEKGRGYLQLDYDATINQEQTRTHQLRLQIEEESK
ncbi:Uncharacterized beta-barrel protein YwiB, DUF1934 family [Pelagirhabdus alkalitolerans]|uniref:Uncharacterized beta-barrel protein YwiB, DUF1934 family n=1 Tax=Pelagirhabdus alkalitolerans TaxID=1612202 RepID=A0A1G6GI45_9BACI|nr:DUF1934 domain-containing protein [Pelagirhabdus alkalitolerans]SDB81620.1 Uncharacterized beta-barrel protein YwiB, DUF1934 family [Pelagirhabdus alkalitolerans]